ncbi:MAG: hypothetical protein GEV10_15580 [Streptosporangiales bacterium]|nr:hypothetical protein [Streptosporangiales bacterium]
MNLLPLLAMVLGAVVLVLFVALLFVRPGWLRSRRAPAPIAPLSSPPTYPRALRAPAEGGYLGTVRVSDGSAVRIHGLGGRGRVKLVLAAEGLVLERRGTNDLLVDEQELGGGEVREGVLVVRWTHGGVALETSIRLDPTGDTAGWARSLRQMGIGT